MLNQPAAKDKFRCWLNIILTIREIRISTDARKGEKEDYIGRETRVKTPLNILKFFEIFWAIKEAQVRTQLCLST
jgi:hypothetical protein